MTSREVLHFPICCTARHFVTSGDYCWNMVHLCIATDAKFADHETSDSHYFSLRISILCWDVILNCTDIVDYSKGEASLRWSEITGVIEGINY